MCTFDEKVAGVEAELQAIRCGYQECLFQVLDELFTNIGKGRTVVKPCTQKMI